MYFYQHWRVPAQTWLCAQARFTPCGGKAGSAPGALMQQKNRFGGRAAGIESCVHLHPFLALEVSDLQEMRATKHIIFKYHLGSLATASSPDFSLAICRIWEVQASTMLPDLIARRGAGHLNPPPLPRNSPRPRVLPAVPARLGHVAALRRAVHGAGNCARPPHVRPRSGI